MSINRDYAKFLKDFHSKKFVSLRDAQKYVLKEYANSFTTISDVAIELPTGAGKTLISLLVAEAWRQNGRKVAILSANKTLARQMLQEAEALGIPAILMEGRGQDIPAPDKRGYQRATHVAIMNYWVYFNQNPVIDPADLLIMDDAHLAEHCLHSLYSVEIKKHEHEYLFNSLVAELQARYPEYSVLADAVAGDTPPTSSTELLSFIDQVDALERIREIIDASPYQAADVDFGFRWRRIRNHLREANIYLSLNSIWIRPYIYPLISNIHYTETTQRLYMSATVGDPGDLSRRLGVRRIAKITIPQEYSETTSGRRLVVMNRIEEADIPERLGKVILSALNVHPKSVWLCASEAEARHLQGAVSELLNQNGLIGHSTWLLTPLGDEIDEFKRALKGHLFVAGRFDGMDFKADECRLVVLTTLPRAINIQEEFISAYLRDSGFMLRRLNQRVVQALGRCNRSDEDYGVYVLADRRFATHFGRESNRVGLPKNIIAEIDMAQDEAEIGEDVLLNKVQKFLKGEFKEYDKNIKDYVSGVPTSMPSQEIIDTSEDEVIGWASMYQSQNYDIAADRFEQSWDAALKSNLIEIGALYGWQWAKALYLQSLLNEPAARGKALEVFERAIKRGGTSSWFNRMRASLNRARQDSTQDNEVLQADYSDHLLMVFDDLLEKYGAQGNRFEKWCESISACLKSESHAQYQEGLERLGQVLGYNASRPRYDSATDCRWRGVFGNSREVVTFEAKIEHDSLKEITAASVGQAHNQYTRAFSEYSSQGYIVRGTIVSHLESLSKDAEASAGAIKLITKDSVFKLWERVRLILSLYRSSWSLYDISARTASAQSIKSKLPPTGWLIKAINSDARLISDLLQEWGK
jgi:hypothetical protein